MASVSANRIEVRDAGRALRGRDRFLGRIVSAFNDGIQTAIIAALEPSAPDPLFLAGYLGEVFTLWPRPASWWSACSCRRCSSGV